MPPSLLSKHANLSNHVYSYNVNQEEESNLALPSMVIIYYRYRRSAPPVMIAQFGENQGKPISLADFDTQASRVGLRMVMKMAVLGMKEGLKAISQAAPVPTGKHLLS